MVKLVQREFYPLLEELQSTDEDFVIHIVYNTQKNKFIAFVQQIMETSVMNILLRMMPSSKQNVKAKDINVK